MAHSVEFFLDDDAADQVRSLWRRLDGAGVPAAGTPGRPRPHVTFAAAGAIPPRTAAALRADLRMLSLPDLWLATVGTFPAAGGAGAYALWLGAVVDAELLAVHSAVHDVLAGAVRQPSAYYLPGSWVPHCTLARDLTGDQLASAVRALHPLAPVRAKIGEVGITDTRTGAVDVLVSR